MIEYVISFHLEERAIFCPIIIETDLTPVSPPPKMPNQP
jgi:hypothetical protein